MSNHYVRTASVDHIGSTHADRLSRHPFPANHHCDTLQAGVKPPFWYTTDVPQVLPVVIFLGSVVSVLFYWGVLQFVITKMAWLMQFTMATTAAESFNAAANIFLGMVCDWLSHFTALFWRWHIISFSTYLLWLLTESCYCINLYIYLYTFIYVYTCIYLCIYKCIHLCN